MELPELVYMMDLMSNDTDYSDEFDEDFDDEDFDDDDFDDFDEDFDDEELF